MISLYKYMRLREGQDTLSPPEEPQERGEVGGMPMTVSGERGFEPPHPGDV
jgi:hypothetical protein